MKAGLNDTLGRTLDILLAYDEDHARYTVDDLAEKLSMPKSSVYRYVRFLQDKGLLVRTGYNNTYALGVTILKLARSLRRGDTLISRSLPYMRELAQRLGMTVLLAKNEGLNVICLDRVEPQLNGLRISFEAGATLPPHASAVSKLLLAWRDAGDIAEAMAKGLPAYTRSTVTDCEALLEELKRIRMHGFAISQSELDPGTLGLAVPIRDHDDVVIAGLCLAAPASRTSLPELLQHRHLLEQAARAIHSGLAE